MPGFDSSSDARGAIPRLAPPSGFARQIAAEARAHLARTGDHRYADRAQWLTGAAVLATGIAAYAALLGGAGAGVPLVQAGLVVLAATTAFMLLVTFGHDASHGSLSRHGAVNRAAVFGSFAILGVSGALWRDRHIRLHHPFPNLPGTGVDADASTLVRLAPDKAHHPAHAAQPAYGMLAYALGLALLVWVEDVALFRRARREQPQGFGGAGPLCAFVATKLIHAALFIALPALLLRPSALALLGGYVLASGIVSLCFALLVIGTHVSDLAELPQPGADGRIAHDWAGLQLATSVDWSPASPLAARLTGGANAHAAHHLFPGFSHRHGPALSRIVAEAAAAHGLAHRVTSFGGMAAGHWRHLVALSRRRAPVD